MKTCLRALKVSVLVLVVQSFMRGSWVSATSMIDQEQPIVDEASGANYAIGGPSEQKLAQVVTEGIPGMLTEVRVPLACAYGNLTIEIQEVSEDNKPSGVVLASETVPAYLIYDWPEPPYFRGFIFSTPATFSAESRFAIVLSSDGSCGCKQGPLGNSYEGGDGFYDSRPNTPGVWVPLTKRFDLPFQTMVEPFDSDSDGIYDYLDNCIAVNNPGQIDSDEDGFGDECDDCSSDPNKTEPGVCGCGVSDLDTDNDGTPDCNDDFPDDQNEWTDTDGDGAGNNADIDDDNDGLADSEEQGPSGNDSNYDGNGDGTADSLQSNVTSFYTHDDQNYVTLEIPSGTTFTACQSCDNPSDADAPSDIEFPYGFFEFTIEGVGHGDSVAVTMHLPSGSTFDTYYKFGFTPNEGAEHWYEFLYNGQTGAEIDEDAIMLHFVDGERGDDDLSTDGTIVDMGGPGVSVSASGEGGGGGCFIATAAYGSPMQPYVKTLGEFRDRFMLQNSIGSALVDFYYRCSPAAADFISKHGSVKAIVRLSLLPIVGMSWVTLKIGPLYSVILALLLCTGFLGLIYIIRKFKYKHNISRQASKAVAQ